MYIPCDTMFLILVSKCVAISTAISRAPHTETLNANFSSACHILKIVSTERELYIFLLEFKVPVKNITNAVTFFTFHF